MLHREPCWGGVSLLWSGCGPPGWAGSSMDGLGEPQSRLLLAMESYNLRTKRRNLHPRMQKLKILFAFIIFHLFVFSNVHPEERCWFIEAAAARHSHWGTSEELYSRGKESTLSMLQAQRTRKPTSDLSFPHPQLWRNKEGRQTAGGREQEMFKPGK